MVKGGAGFPALAFLFFLALSAPQAWAHKTSLAHLAVEGRERAAVSLSLSAHDLAAALGLAADPSAPVPFAEIEASRKRIEEYLDARLALRLGERPCLPGDMRIEELRKGEELRIHRLFACPPGAGSLAISYRLFFDIDAGHRAIVEAGGRQTVLDRDFTTARLTAEAPTPGLARLVLLGVEHILFGIDHVLFLIALMLGLPRAGPAVAMVSAFTVAHSATLALAWYGLLALPSRLVETAIALSIAYVAAENLMGRGIERRWLIAGLFGLVHGLGFYGALAGLGLAGADAATVLLGFNLGVELGQLIVLGAAAPLLWWAARRSWRQAGVRLASAACLSVALWWAAERAFA
jgi:hypothetical protein